MISAVHCSPTVSLRVKSDGYPTQCTSEADLEKRAVPNRSFDERVKPSHVFIPSVSGRNYFTCITVLFVDVNCSTFC